MKRFFTHVFVLSFFLSLSLGVSGQAFWSEDFSGGDIPSGWTSEDLSGGAAQWTWCANPETGQDVGCPAIWDDGTNNQVPFAATTATNGFVTMDSDILQELATNHQAVLTTTAIDCSVQPVVWVNFETHIGVYTLDAVDNAILKVSTNGTEWTDFTVFPELTTTERWSANPEHIAINISAVAANQATVYLRWFWEGNWEYNWSIDDIVLSSADPTPANDLVLGNFRGAPNYITPLEQVDTVFFMCDISNEGTDDQTNVTIEVKVDDGGGNNFFTTSENVGTIEADSAYTYSIAEFYIPDAIGEYLITYTVTQDSTDANDSNNTASRAFEVSEDLYAKDNGIVSATQPGSFPPDATSWEFGNYYVVKNATYAEKAIFSVASNDNAHQGQIAVANLYKIVEDGDGDFDDDDVVLVGIGEKEYTDEENYTIDTVTFINAETFESYVLLEPGEYLLMVQYTLDMFGPYCTLPYPYTVSTVVHDNTWYLGGFTGDITFFGRMIVGDGDVAVPEVITGENVFDVFPNPAKNTINISIELEESSKNVMATITDLTGKIISTKEFSNVKNQISEFDISNLASGAYFMKVQTDKGIKTKRFVVSK